MNNKQHNESLFDVSLYGITNKEGIEISKSDYPSIHRFKNDLAIACKSYNEWGAFDRDGNIIIPFIYSSIDYREDYNVYVVLNHGGERGILDLKGKIILPCEYYFISFSDFPYNDNFKNNFFEIRKDCKNGLINKDWKIVVPCIYESIKMLTLFNSNDNSEKNMIIVSEEYKFEDKIIINQGIIDLSNPQNILIPCIYDSIEIINDWYFIVKDVDYKVRVQNAEWYNNLIVVDKKLQLKVVESDLIEKVIDFNFKVNNVEYIYKVRNVAYELGVIDCKGNQVLPCKFHQIKAINSAGYITVGFYNEHNSLIYGVFDSKGNEVIPICYERIGEINEEGLVTLSKNSKSGIFKIGVGFIIPCQYNDMSKLNEGLAAVLKDGKWGFVDIQNTLIIPCIYECAFDFIDDLAIVVRNDKWGILNSKNNIVVPCIYENIYSFSEGLAAVKKNGKWGFINNKGQLIIKCQYDLVDSFKDGVAAVSKFSG